MNHKKSIGARGEELAAEYLTRDGYTVTARNFRVGHDEIDIIAENEQYIVFTEVKSRTATKSNLRFGRPATAVDYKKRQRLLRSAEEYLRQNKPAKRPRIDVIEVYFPPIREGSPIDVSTLTALEIKHLRNAVHY